MPRGSMHEAIGYLNRELALFERVHQTPPSARRRWNSCAAATMERAKRRSVRRSLTYCLQNAGLPIPDSNLRLLAEMGRIGSSHLRRRFGSTAQARGQASSQRDRARIRRGPRRCVHYRAGSFGGDPLAASPVVSHLGGGSLGGATARYPARMAVAYSGLGTLLCNLSLQRLGDDYFQESLRLLTNIDNPPVEAQAIVAFSRRIVAEY